MKIIKLCGTPDASYWEKLLEPNFTNERVQMLKSFKHCDRSIDKAFSGYPEDMVDLLDKILVIDPEKRICLREARDHRFFKGSYSMNAKLCPNCNEYHNELESFNMRSTHENDLSKRKEDEMERRRKIREDQQIHMKLLKEEERRRLQSYRQSKQKLHVLHSRRENQSHSKRRGLLDPAGRL